jgi:hypothetical protein
MFQTEVREALKAHVLYSINFFPENRNVEKHCRVGQVTDDNIVRRVRIACGIPKATKTHPEHVILIAFGRQQWLRGSAPVHVYLRTETDTVI